MTGKNGSNGNGTGEGAHLQKEQGRGSYVQQQLLSLQRPARVVSLFTAREMSSSDLERLVGVCLRSMREEDPTASLDLSPLGDAGPAEMHRQNAFRVTVRATENDEPHDCYVNLYAMSDPASPHRGLLAHLSGMDPEMGRATKESVEPAQAYLEITSGRLDDQARIHPFQNLVALFSTALNALIVDAAAAMVTMDPAEWAQALEMSLEIESGMKLLRR